MDEIKAAHSGAVTNTKRKILEDISKYMETLDDIPSFEAYLADRIQYIEQLWLNVWLNKATNGVSKIGKKEFLERNGFETEGVDRKLINSLFRNEMREFCPFSTAEWLRGEVEVNPGLWEELYKEARERLKKRKEAEKRIENRAALLRTMSDDAERILVEGEWLLYLVARHRAALKLESDINTRIRYKKVDPLALEEKLIAQGSFNPNDFLRAGDFFEELTGEIHKTFYRGRMFYEYETYYFEYERALGGIVLEYATRLVSEKLPEGAYKEYLSLEMDEGDENNLALLVSGMAEELSDDFLERISEEYLEDLLRLAPIPFNEETHKEMYESDMAKAEERLIREKAEAERKAEEERRMLEEVFGSEYRPTAERNVKYVLHIGETNTGKTHQALEAMKSAESGIYLAPLRLLALEVYDRLNSDGVPCSLKTGEEEKVEPSAAHISCTVEMFHEKDYYEVAVIDEAQMVADRDRGFSWYKAITKANAKEVHIIGSINIKNMVVKLLGNAEYELREYRRDLPLQVEDQEFSLKKARKGDALVCFSRKQVLATAAILQANGHKVSMIYGSMPPETRKKQMQLFISGQTEIVVSTDAIGMGLNLPIRRIVFLENEKFDGTARRRLTSQEIKQIAGRAGRKGIYNIGRVAFVSDIQRMKRVLEGEDLPVKVFAIAPTSAVFERFQKYSRSLGEFFELWEKFESPPGTKKAELTEERNRYELIEGTMIERRFPMMELYGFLHLPFSAKEPQLTEQWLGTMAAIAEGRELPEPEIKKRSLEEMELTYKAIGLHLLFLYKLGKRTEAIYWERVREQVSDSVHEELKDVTKSQGKKCRNCGKSLPLDFAYPICDQCHSGQNKRKNHSRRGWRQKRKF
ncbi:RNA helicase [Neobacillus piezotolerans]|uniref:RNA helicase n=1 Tax=Neobacillus piezotolerans TaxID=2259171 RepID=A0A3D8GPY2_9BACI|nr:helicase-related protein [Neobacillus piezotolerans]RDU36544.1 RNA helicase [Neobacillus piezotolerans]